jgi:hypothetical protein
MSLFKPIVALFLMALLADLIVQFGILWRIHFAFSMTHGVSILICIIGVLYAFKSRHMKDIVKDWVRAH